MHNVISDILDKEKQKLLSKNNIYVIINELKVLKSKEDNTIGKATKS